MITVGNYPDLASARLAQSVLDAEGLFTNIPDEHLAGLDWQMGTALHGIRLQVAPEDVERATQLLTTAFAVDHHDVSETQAGEAAPAADLCPACGSDAIGPPKWKNRVKAAALIFPPLLLVWPLFAAFAAHATCSSCGRNSRTSRNDER